MTAEEAIKILETGSVMPAFLYTAEEFGEACRMAITALRAQTEAKQANVKIDRKKWEGCAACRTKLYVKTIQYLRPAAAPLTPEQELRDRLSDLTGEVYVTVNKRFCHVCGKPIIEKAWAELERMIGGKDGKTN